MSAKDLTDALRALSEPAQATDPAVPAAMKTRGAAGVARGSAVPGGGDATGGIASPLVETAYTARTFHANTTITSSDGLFTLIIKPVKSIKFKDAASRDVTIEFKVPA